MSKALKRIYIIENKTDNTKTMVQASTVSQAINAIMKNTYEAKVATGIEVAALVTAGQQIVVAETKAKEPLVPTQTPESLPEDGGEDDGHTYTAQYSNIA